jgi:serine/threonine protein kinase
VALDLSFSEPAAMLRTAVGVPPALIDLPQPGETFAGKYSIVRIIGEGGMGKVYEAIHLRLRQRMAIKMLVPRVLDMPDVVARFEREGRTAAQLRSRHVARILDVDTTPAGVPFMVMEYLEGHDLDVELQQRGQLPVAEGVGYVCQACEAMEEAHGLGIVHRDLKPANLFLCPERTELVVKVLDFGISKMQDEGDARLTGTHATMGTPLYMSPEQVRSSKDVDYRTDIWSLGVILFEALTGRPPFVGSTTGAAAAIVADPPPSPRDLRPEITPELEAAILRALEKDPRNRFQDVHALLAAIMPFAPPVAMSVPSIRHAHSPSGVPAALPATLHSARSQTPAAAAPASHASAPPAASSGPSVRSSASGAKPETGAIASAPTLAQASPSEARPSAPQQREAAQATSPGWSSVRSPHRKASRRRRALVATATLLVAGALGVGFVARRARISPPAAPGTTGDVPELTASAVAVNPPGSAFTSASPPSTGAPMVASAASSVLFSPAAQAPRTPTIAPRRPTTHTGPPGPASASPSAPPSATPERPLYLN